MLASALCVSMIKQEEGLRLIPYPDSAGFMTVGWGHLLKKEDTPDKITLAAAEGYFSLDLMACEEAVDNNVKVPLTQNQYDALADFCFNLGSKKFKGSGLLRELNKENYNEVPRRLMMWDKVSLPDGTKKVVRGLKLRRMREVNVWNNSDYSEVQDDTL